MLKPDIKSIMALQDIMVWNMVYQKIQGTDTEQHTEKGLQMSRAELYGIYHRQNMGCVTRYTENKELYNNQV